MARALRTAAILLALGATGWLAWEMLGEDLGGSGAGVQAEAPPDAPRDADLAPHLAGRAGAVASARSAHGGLAIHGRVVDALGQPAPGVPVGVTRRPEIAAWDSADPGTWGTDRAADIRRALADHADPPRDRVEPEHGAVSDEEGRFRVVGLPPGAYGVSARPAAPRAGTTALVTLRLRQEADAVTLRVRDGVGLRGRVLDAQGAGVAAVLRATAIVSGDSFGAGPVSTAPDGRFGFEALVPGSWRFSLVVPGRVTIEGLRVQVPHEGEWTIRLPGSGASLSGRVLDASGDGVAGAELLVRVGAAGSRDQAGAVVSARSDAEGAFRIDGAPEGDVHQVRALAEGFVPYDQSQPQAPWSGLALHAGQEAVLEITLAGGATIEGRVSEVGTGRPLPGVEVFALAGQWNADRTPVARSDRDGAYRLEGVAPGKHVILARSPTHYMPEAEEAQGQVSWSDGVALAAGPPPDVLVVVGEARETVRRDIRLARGFVARGVVLDPDGAPAPGATVHAHQTGMDRVGGHWGVRWNGWGAAIATADAAGRFEVANLPPREDLVLHPRKPGLVGRPTEAFATGEGRDVPELTLHLERGAVLVVRVSGPRGEPISEAWVNAWSRGQSLVSSSPSGRTDAQGTIRLEGVPPGATTTVMVNSQGQGSQQAQVESLSAGEERDVAVHFAGGESASGVLVDEDGSPVSRHSIGIQSAGGAHLAQTHTEEDGGFSFGGLPRGQARLQHLVQQPQGHAQWVAFGDPFDIPVSGLRVVLPKSATHVIEGTIVDPTGALVPLCVLKIHAGGAQTPSYYGGPSQDELVGGRFRRQVEGSPPFQVRVLLPRDARGVPLNLREHRRALTEVPEGPIEIRLEGGHEVTGRVVGPDDRGVPRVILHAGTSVAQTDASGAFCLSGLAHARAAIQFRVPPGWVAPGTVQAVAGEPLLVRLAGGVAIAGRVLGPEDRPVTQGNVQVTWPAHGSTSAGSVSAYLQVGGAFRAEGIPAGARARVRVQTWGTPMSAPTDVEDVPAGTTDLVIRIEEGLSIQGSVVDAQGRPVGEGGLSIQAIDDPSPSAWSQVQGDGSFHVRGLKPLRYRIRYQRQGTTVVHAPLEVTPPATGLRIVLPEARTVRGRLSGAAPGPQTFHVYAWPAGHPSNRTAPVRPAEDGSFELANLGDGAFVVGATDGKDHYAIAMLAPGATSVSLTVESGLTIEGRLEDGGRPAERGTVEAQGANWWVRKAVDAEGRFRLQGLPPGTYRLHGRSVDWQRTSPAEEVEAGRSGVVLRL